MLLLKMTGRVLGQQLLESRCALLRLAVRASVKLYCECAARFPVMVIPEPPFLSHHSHNRMKQQPVF